MRQASTAATESPAFGTSPFVALDPAFEAVIGEAPQLALVLEVNAHEGPVYVASEEALYFTTTPRRTAPTEPPQVDIMRLSLAGDRFPLGSERLTVIRADANVANGMTLDHQGRLVVCEQGTLTTDAAVTRVDPSTGSVASVIDAFDGRRLNSPNDVVVKSDRTIWFTDPRYGHLQGFRPVPEVGDFVYRYDPTSGGLTVVADSFDKPNGLAFSPDEAVLYVGDSGANQEPGSFHPERAHHIRAFDVRDGDRLAGERPFADTNPGFPDGLKVDSAGRVYASSFAGVQVFSPDGDLIGEIRLPGAVNFVFGGPQRNVLFITADEAIWAAVLAATGPSPTTGV